MADSMSVSGGVRNNVQSLVSVDQVTITGDGTTEHPLQANIGEVPVTTDHVTILGNGTTGDPLRAGEVPVTTDHVTILGNGTTGDPLRAFPQVIAAASVNSIGTYIAQIGFTGAIGTPSTGQYQLTMADPPLSTAFLVLSITVSFAGGGQATYDFDSNDVVHVYTFDGSGSASDRFFSISILKIGDLE